MPCTGKKNIRKPDVQYEVVLKELCELLCDKTGQPVTPQTHWLQVAVEMTRDAPNYCLLKIQAFKR